jgi:hypothetical protein
VLDDILRPSRGRIAVRGAVTVHGPVSTALGLLAALRGEADEARTLLREAATFADAMGAERWADEARRALADAP